jgi:hypothetical protein
MFYPAYDFGDDGWLDSFDHAKHSGDVEMREETKARLVDLGYLH